MDAHSDDFEIEPLEGGWRIARYCGEADYVAVPERIDGRPVIHIGSHAFEDRRGIVGVELPATVSFIGSFAFSDCRALEEAVVPPAVSSISLGTFMNCCALRKVGLPEGLKTIGDGAFRNCTSLVSIGIPSGVSSLGDSAFMNCRALESVDVPESVTTISRSVFRDCSSLADATVTDKLTAVLPRAFQGCPRLESVRILGGSPEATLAAFRNCKLTYLVADPTIERRLFSFEDAVAIMGSPFDPERLFACRVIASYPERLDEIRAKFSVLKTLCTFGRLGELRVFEGRRGYFTRANLIKCMDAASEAGHSEVVAWLMELKTRMDERDAAAGSGGGLEL